MYLAEYGVVAPRTGPGSETLEDADSAPPGGRRAGLAAPRQIDEFDEKIDGFDRELWTNAREDEETARLMTISGIGPIDGDGTVGLRSADAELPGRGWASET